LRTFATIPSPGPGKFGQMLGQQMVLFQSIHGGKLNSPTLNGLNALRVIGYWWRQRGRHWPGWHQCLKKLEASLGRPLAKADAFKLLTEAQSATVWKCAREAVADMKRIRNARNLPPGVFSDRQSMADAKEIVTRYLTGNLESNIPPALKPLKPKTTTTPATKTAAAQKIWPPTAATVTQAKPKPSRLVPPPPKIPDDLFDRVPRIKRPRLNLSGKVGWLILAAIIADEMRNR